MLILSRINKILIILLIFTGVSFAKVGDYTPFKRPIDLGVHGNVYPIIEPDIYDELMEKLKQVDMDKKVEEFRAKVRQAYKVHYDLPQVKEKGIEYIDLIYTVPDDIVIGGKVLYRKGQKINLVQQGLGFDELYFVIGQDDLILGLEYIRKRYGDKGLNRLALLISDGDLIEIEDILVNKYKQYNIRLYRLVDSLKNRFKIAAQPALIYQKGNRIVVEYIPLVRGAN